MRDLSEDAVKDVEHKIVTVDAPQFEDSWIDQETKYEALPPFEIASMDTPIITVHSSGELQSGISSIYKCTLNSTTGSTNFPKPIVITHRVFVRWSMMMRERFPA